MIEHFQQMNPALEMTLNPHVEKRVKRMIRGGRRGTEIFLGRSATFFPVFEAYLEAYDLPTELKYLSVVESALKQDAKSKAGAAGLWQFMPRTGKAYGLDINQQVDERLDLFKSTESAVRYLADLHKSFKDWPLALAAYNCGPGRVRKAMKERRSRDFWNIRSLLPKETQDYVVKWMATTYVMSYYYFYDLRPAYPDYDLQFIKAIKIYSSKSLTRISKETGAPIAVLRKLNPSYKQGIVPSNPYGNFVVVPKIGLIKEYDEMDIQAVSLKQ
ncbi:MAG: lytic transglycosylase domain-containing protein [Saprospiraceae bacterium]|nr:lytic transglycosylase domain-containing protein [Saprospiraceae bacterium]